MICGRESDLVGRRRLSLHNQGVLLAPPITLESGHSGYRFVRLGIPVPVAVGLAYLGTAMTGVIALIVSRVDPLSSWIFGSLAFATMAVAGGLLLRVRVYPDE